MSSLAKLDSFDSTQNINEVLNRKIKNNYKELLKQTELEIQRKEKSGLYKSFIKKAYNTLKNLENSEYTIEVINPENEVFIRILLKGEEAILINIEELDDFYYHIISKDVELIAPNDRELLERVTDILASMLVD